MPNSLLEGRENSIPWWQDPAIRLALATVIVPGLYRLAAWIWPEFPLSQERATTIVVDGITMVGGAIWIIRRVKRGKNPMDPAPTITLTDNN